MIEEVKILQKTEGKAETSYVYQFKLKKDKTIYQSEYFYVPKRHVLKFSIFFTEIENQDIHIFSYEEAKMIQGLLLQAKEHRLRHLLNPYKIL